MIKRLLDWWGRRQSHQLQQCYQTGFCWAMTAYFRENTSLEEIESLCNFQETYRSPLIPKPGPFEREFDRGARAALAELSRLSRFPEIFDKKDQRP